MAMLYRPLFTTSWMLDDALAEAAFHGARRVAISSASSKTAFGLAYLLRGRRAVEVIGLTSASHVPFVQSLGCYDRVLAYSDVGRLPADTPLAYVDFSGAAGLRRALHQHLGGGLVYDCTVGAADWSARAPYDKSLPGAAPQFFFAPARIEQRIAEWGRAAWEARLAEASAAFLAAARPWLKIVRERGRDAVDGRWIEAVEGRSPADVGLVLAL
jgi:hypothetical protein